ncbi:DUF1287 domain-containing protein [Chloracidobacterium sp. MS 40/45]|uniref:DUF1287 domain-containing protein n=1 Tax=Chloracidobacterium aggregatum TaxID=2851959 RepID=UPI001B8C9AF5|nr:DUF1287 domain-containing protein [Chloracidobacterium aggregatum]QUW01520.1 DUF1287 domain-containing protein [Chloracidobacterium sp. MS 40/45]
MRFALLVILALWAVACRPEGLPAGAHPVTPATPERPLSPPVRALLASAREQTRTTTGYDPTYVRIGYPGGDVPAHTGVCTDVILRAFRAAGVDLQVAVHEDMRRAFRAYPKRWGLARPDPNIDHRRVPNLMVYFQRRGCALAPGRRAADYLPGDVVTWDLGSGVPHIGLVMDEVAGDTGRPLIVHNIGAGARLEDVLFAWRVTGHYRYFP